MKYRLYFEEGKQHLVKQGRFLVDITKPQPYQDNLVTAVLLVDGLKGRLQKLVVFGELKKWKNRNGDERSFVRIDNHQSGKYILTPYRLEEVLETGATPINKNTDFKRIELRGESIEEIFNTYNEELASSDTRPFVLAQQDGSL